MTDKGVIFDVDGVLIDSYEAHFLAWRDLTDTHGFDLTEELFAQSFGRTSREVIALWWGQDCFSPGQVQEMTDRKEAIYREKIASSFPEVPGARELIQALDQAGFKMAVGSSGPPGNVAAALDVVDPEQRIVARITGEDVEVGKPDPQVFLLAAERLALPPQRCVVIEDAAPGIAAAQAAGAASVGYIGAGRTAEELRAADLVVTSLTELSPGVLTSLL